MPLNKSVQVVTFFGLSNNWVNTIMYITLVSLFVCLGLGPN